MTVLLLGLWTLFLVYFLLKVIQEEQEGQVFLGSLMTHKLKSKE